MWGKNVRNSVLENRNWEFKLNYIVFVQQAGFVSVAAFVEVYKVQPKRHIKMNSHEF